MSIQDGAEAPGGKNADIEVLRAIAVLLTVVCHFRNLLEWKGLWSNTLSDLPLWGGVDLFFCISGFVITSSLLRQRRTARFEQLAIPFWIRRIFRIWPAALVWLALPLLCAALFNSTGAFGNFRSNLMGSGVAAAQVANLYYMVCGPVGGPGHWPCGRAEVYWSLSLEEQFYLIFPVLLYFLRPVVLRRVLLAVILAQALIPRPDESPLWYVRTDAISFGVLIALARFEGLLPASVLGFMQRRIAVRWISILLMAAVATLPSIPALEINVGLLAVTSAALVLIASENAGIIVPGRWLRSILLWTGSRSFAIYLVHNPCFAATREIFHRFYPHTTFDDGFTIAFLVMALALIGLVSEATYRVVEAPLRGLGRVVAKRWEDRFALTRGSPLTSTSVV